MDPRLLLSTIDIDLIVDKSSLGGCGASAVSALLVAPAFINFSWGVVLVTGVCLDKFAALLVRAKLGIAFEAALVETFFASQKLVQRREYIRKQAAPRRSIPLCRAGEPFHLEHYCAIL